MYFSENINELFTALSKAQGEFKAIPFDKVNPHFKSKYASLSATQEMVRPILAKHGLSFIQSIYTNETGRYEVHTVLAHSSGQSIRTKMDLMLGRQDMQSLGSAVTYAKRYALQAILGIAGDDDDDGNAAVQSSAQPTKSKKTEPSKSGYQKFQGPSNSFVVPFGTTKGKKLGELDHEQLAKIREWTTAQLKSKPRPKNIAEIADLHDHVKNMQSELDPVDQPPPDFEPQHFPSDEQLPPEAYHDNPFDEFQEMQPLTSAPKASETPNLAPPSGQKTKSDDGPGAFILPALMEPRGFQNLHGKRLDSFQPAVLDTYLKALKAESVKSNPKPPNVAEMFGVIGKIKAYLETF